MSRLGAVAKKQIEKKRYTVDYTCWLDENESVIDFAIAIEPSTTPPLIADGASASADFKKITAYLSQGKAGQIYTVMFITDTSIGQRKADELQMRVV